MSCKRGCCASQIEHYRSIRLSSTATPSRKGTYVAQRTQAEAQLSKDLDAYKTVAFEQGVQPKQIDGIADLAKKAETKAEIEAGVALSSNKQRTQLKEVMGG